MYTLHPPTHTVNCRQVVAYSTASEDMDVENISSYPNDSETGLSKSEQIEMAIGHVNAAFLILFFIVGLPWNALVVGIILKKKLFIRPSLMLMLNLAVTNFLVCLLVMPFPILFGIIANLREDADKMCQAGVLLVMLPSLSIHTVAIMSIDRFIYLKNPTTYKQIVFS